MTDYRYYQQISPNVYKRKSLNSQFVIVAALLFAVGAWFFLKRAPQVEAYIFSGILFIFGCCFIVKMFSSVVIDGNSQLITQKIGAIVIQTNNGLCRYPKLQPKQPDLCFDIDFFCLCYCKSIQ